MVIEDWVESNLACNQMSDWQNQKTAKRGVHFVSHKYDYRKN